MRIELNVPSGRWAVGVSGGADSVCLLALLRDQPNISLHVVHLDHETRGGESAVDAAFVMKLAKAWGLACTVAKRSEILPGARGNLSSQYREARLELFRREAEAHQLQGIILGHHADDQAETVLQRLLRGSGATGLGGIRQRSRVGGLLMLHPLLPYRSAELRDELRRREILWREDATNASPRYLRNRLRLLLNEQPGLHEAMMELGKACAGYHRALDAASPELGESFQIGKIADVAPSLARHALRRWLRQRGTDADDLNAAAVSRLMVMVTDAAAPARQSFPGGLQVHRRRGAIFVERSGGGL